MSPPLQFSDVTVTYGEVTALSNVSTTFDAGFNVVLGPNGAGKTTLFRVGAGVLPPDEGTVDVEGIDPFTAPGVKRSVGYLPHGTPINGRLTVRENLDYWGRVHGFEAAERAERIDRVVESMDLEQLISRPGTDLSRGQKQRVTIARCLLSDPSVLFLDEPTTGLDPTAATALRERLSTLADEGRTLCYSTHNLYEAELLADELTVVSGGEVVAQGPRSELTASLRGGGPTRVRVSCDADRADFQALGIEATREERAWLVELPEDYRVPTLIRELVERGTDIEAVRPEETTLEDLYHELAGGESDD